MKKNVIIIFLFIALVGGVTKCVQAKDFTNSVVKIFVTSNSVDYYHPWQSHGLNAATGSGAIVAGNKILTNAHVIADYTFIQVKKDDDPKKYTAKVEAIAHDCDLALLSVDDPAFFDGTTQLSFGVLPKMQDTVTVLGYPEGGDKISITKGVVSRIELNSYSQSGRQLLTVQIDAAINPGNSGGPVIMDDKMVGIAMQVFQSAQNIGYMIPLPVIEHFFQDLKDSRYDGFPVIGIDFSTTENSALRQLFKIDKIEGGVLVNNVMPLSSASNVLKEGDVILSIDGIPIGEDGTFAFRGNERLSMPHLITMKQMNENIEFSIIRQGEKQMINVQLEDFKPLVAYPYFYEKPPFYIYGGLVFTALSSDLLKAWGMQWWEKAPLDFTHYLAGSGRLNKERKKDIIVLLNVLPDEINVGYHNLGNQIIESVNGQKFSSFKEFVQLLNKINKEEEYAIFETNQKSQIIMRNKNMDEITRRILERNNIANQYSQEVANWLNGMDVLPEPALMR